MGLDWQNSYFLVLFAAAILHGLYLALIVTVRAKKGSSEIWLSMVLFGISAVLMNYFIYISDAIRQFPHLLNVFIPLMYLTGPSFYFFILKSDNQSFRLGRIHLIHLIPVLYILGESTFIFLWPAHEKLAAINGILESRTPTFMEIIIGNRFNLLTTFYSVAAYFYLSSRVKGIVGKQVIRVKWLKKFSLVFSCLLIGSMLLPMIFMMFSWGGAEMELTLTLVYALSIHALGYVIIKNQKQAPWNPPQSKYSTSPLVSVQLLDYREKILRHLEQNKPWLVANFSISDLSDQLGLPKHHLSQVLNEEIDMSFIDLVNSYRVEEAKNKLRSGALQKYSVMGIAMDCGFASKSTFNRTFKKFTGMTPSSYLPEVDKARQGVSTL